MNVKIYTTNNTTYLGTLVKKTITGIKVQEGVMTPDIFATLLKAELLGETHSQRVGKNDGIGIRELTRREQLDFNVVIEEMKTAEEMAGDWILSKVFDEFRTGKKS